MDQSGAVGEEEMEGQWGLPERLVDVRMVWKVGRKISRLCGVERTKLKSHSILYVRRPCRCDFLWLLAVACVLGACDTKLQMSLDGVARVEHSYRGIHCLHIRRASSLLRTPL